MFAGKRLYIWLALLVLAGIAFGCEDRVPSPEASIRTYLADWEKADYDGMYDKLSAAAKSSIAKEAFVSRHKTVYEGISASRLEVKLAFTAKESPSENGRDTFGIHVGMDTLAGRVEFDSKAALVLENNEWRVEWSPGLLFPQLAEGDKVRVQVIKAARGEIKDRSGVGLAINEEKLEIGIVPKDLPEQADASLQRLAGLLKTSVAEIDKKRKASWVKPELFVPITLLSKKDSRLEAVLGIKGVASQTKKARSYPLQEAAAHLTGYIGKISEEELGKLQASGYQADDYIGKAGLEQINESQLRGTDGGRIYIVDKDGKEKGTIISREAVDGKDVTLTIDAALQAKLYAQLDKQPGAGSAIQPLTGEVLALVSSPSYDPNSFVAGVTAEEWKRWSDDPDKPLLNRFARTFSPGSAFKPITAAIALDANTIKPEQERDIVGKQWKKDASWGNYYVSRVSEAASKVNLLKGLLYSDNIYFAQTALEMGEKNFLDQAGKFGFGEKLPLPYPLDASSLLNAQAMKNDIQLADSGYGQGEVVMNPLHVAVAYTAFVNGGNIMAPVMIVPEGKAPTPQIWKPNVIRSETANVITKDLIQVVESPSGTGHGAKVEGLTIAAKTGTAELKQSKGTAGKEVGWFVAYNTDKPRLLLALMMENVQERGGSHDIAPRVKSIFKEYVHS